MSWPLVIMFRFLSTPSARRATPGHQDQQGSQLISIHALREEGDGRVKDDIKPNHISIHALREEGDTGSGCGCCPPCRFLSTPSARRATALGIFVARTLNISIHALREEGDLVAPLRQCDELISIHALREEGDPRRPPTPPGRSRFLSTPSARRATVHLISTAYDRQISIHALREEGDR